MRKLAVLFLLMTVILCGCGSVNTNSELSENSVSVILPDSETATTVNGYFSESALNSETLKSTEYYANKNSKKFHLATCRYAKSIKQENLFKSKNRKLLTSDGYVPCKTCNP